MHPWGVKHRLFLIDLKTALISLNALGKRGSYRRKTEVFNDVKNIVLRFNSFPIHVRKV